MFGVVKSEPHACMTSIVHACVHEFGRKVMASHTMTKNPLTKAGESIHEVFPGSHTMWQRTIQCPLSLLVRLNHHDNLKGKEDMRTSDKQLVVKRRSMNFDLREALTRHSHGTQVLFPARIPLCGRL